MAEKPRTSPLSATGTIIGSLPPTDPAVLEAMRARRAEVQHYAAIGSVAAQWSYFEARIDAACVGLAEIDEQVGVCFTAQIAGSARKLDAYISLARLRQIPKKLIAALDDFAKDTVHLSERRNRVVHDVWIFDHPKPPQRKEATAKRLARIKSVPTATDEVFKLARGIFWHRLKFETLSERVLVERAP